VTYVKKGEEQAEPEQRFPPKSLQTEILRLTPY